MNELNGNRTVFLRPTECVTSLVRAATKFSISAVLRLREGIGQSMHATKESTCTHCKCVLIEWQPPMGTCMSRNFNPNSRGHGCGHAFCMVNCSKRRVGGGRVQKICLRCARACEMDSEKFFHRNLHNSTACIGVKFPGLTIETECEYVFG